MALVLQDNDGATATANAYIDVRFFRAYHDDRGNANTSFLDAQVENAIVRATSYMDVRFKFIGRRRNEDQTTQWPRENARNIDGRYVRGIPLAVQRACAEYALRALSSPLMPDPVRDVSGRKVRSFTDVVGPLTRRKDYGDFGTSYDLPAYPLADGFLKAEGLLVTSRQTVRA